MIKLAAIDHVSRAMEEGEGVVDSNKMIDCVVKDKMVLYAEFSLKFSLVVPIFAFFLFLKSTAGCDVARQVVQPISMYLDVVALVWVEIDVVEGAVMTRAFVWVDTATVDAERAPTSFSTNVRACNVATRVVGTDDVVVVGGSV